MSKARDIADLGSNDVLETTSTGVDVTGTVTADGLTVSGVSNANVQLQSTGGNTYQVRTDINEMYMYQANRGAPIAKFAYNGDVQFYEDTGTTAKMVWDASAESLAIGTTTATAPLHVSGTANSIVSRFVGNTTDGTKIQFDQSGIANWRIGQVPNTDAFAIYGFGAGSYPERLRIDSSGNVGIGTASPSAKLQSVTTNNSTAAISAYETTIGGEAKVDLSVRNNGSSATPVSRVSAIMSSGTVGAEAGHLKFSTMSSGTLAERARIDSSGNLLVGGTSVGNPSGTVSIRSKIQVGYTQGTPTSDNTSSVQVYNRGTDGVYSYVSNVTYNNHMLFLWRGSTAGSITSPNATSVIYGTSSDYRLKENVVSMDNASERVLALNPVRFTWNHTPDLEVDGFLAHEAQEVVPEAVTGSKDEVDADGNPVYQGIDQSKLVPLLTKALQEALTKIEQLETRIETLENN